MRRMLADLSRKNPLRRTILVKNANYTSTICFPFPDFVESKTTQNLRWFLVRPTRLTEMVSGIQLD